MLSPRLLARAPTVLGLLGLAGCGAGLAAGGAVFGAGTCMMTTVEDGASLVLAVAKPPMQVVCKKWLSVPHHATLEAWCNNIPEDLQGLAQQVSAVTIAAALEELNGDPLLPGEASTCSNSTTFPSSK